MIHVARGGSDLSIRTERERPSERQMIHVARGGLANPPPAGSDLSIRTAS
ncbi:hypothetical protein QUF80_04645 [Desulfococcaceae bacterium HSG8]|nr:hypothetical protein [Desulfococcaceae bacterium HSG8]